MSHSTIAHSWQEILRGSKLRFDSHPDSQILLLARPLRRINRVIPVRIQTFECGQAPVVRTLRFLAAGFIKARLYLFRRKSLITILIAIGKKTIPFALQDESIVIGIQLAQKLCGLQAIFPDWTTGTGAACGLVASPEQTAAHEDTPSR